VRVWGLAGGLSVLFVTPWRIPVALFETTPQGPGRFRSVREPPGPWGESHCVCPQRSEGGQRVSGTGVAEEWGVGVLRESCRGVLLWFRGPESGCVVREWCVNLERVLARVLCPEEKANFVFSGSLIPRCGRESW